MKVDKSTWSSIPFTECVRTVKVNDAVQKKDYKTKGLYPIISQEKEFISGYCDNVSNLNKDFGNLIIFGDHTRIIKFIDFDFCVGADGVKVLRPFGHLDAKYLFYFLRWADIPSNGYSRHFKFLKELIIPHPPIDAQYDIASELDALQEVIDGYRDQIADLDALAQSIFLDTFGDPITNSKGWEIKRLDEVCDSQLGKMINQQIQTGELKPFLCAVNVLDNNFYVDEIKKFRLKNDEEEKYRVLPGDLMICEGGDAGRCAIWNKNFEIYYQKSVHRVRSSQLSMQYLMFVLRIYKQQGILAEKSKGATIQHLTRKSLNQLLIMIPPVTLQNSFTEQFVAIEDQKEMLRQQLADAEMLMAERMQYYFS
ncbi:restriction endonuclease subunit S [uncultured Duncaniella sp.]|uniref:restriction endonuclease subunit S n=1 Tax=uncultured Duncaniella sp. TaxID=2768039 RepID=UPI00272C0172|nr:restriction endonuclease subunit S [uncultured Duncaniella sp.]